MARKIWQSSQWRKKREEFIRGKSCQSCRSAEKLAVHHKKDSKNLFFEENQIRKKIIRKLTEELVEKGKVKIKPRLVGYTSECPYCQHKKQIRTIQWVVCEGCGRGYTPTPNRREPIFSTNEDKIPVGIKYNCPFCNQEDTIITTRILNPNVRGTKIEDIFILKCRHCKKALKLTSKNYETVYEKNTYLSRYDYQKIIEDYSPEIQRRLDKIWQKPDYLEISESNSIVLCNKCHVAHHSGRHLCPQCKKNYTKAQFPDHLCYSCFIETSEGKKWLKNKEDREKFIEDLEREDAEFFKMVDKIHELEAKGDHEAVQKLLAECSKNNPETV